MPLAITLRADTAGGQALAYLCDAVAAFEAAPSAAALGYAPHLTLGLYDDGTEAALFGVPAALATGRRPLRLTFDAIRWFDGPPLVVWAAPAACNALMALHDALHARLAPERCHPHFRPGAWVPHCTLGHRIKSDREADARAFAASWRGPVHAAFDRLELVSFPPVRVLTSAALTPGGIRRTGSRRPGAAPW